MRTAAGRSASEGAYAILRPYLRGRVSGRGRVSRRVRVRGRDRGRGRCRGGVRVTRPAALGLGLGRSGC